MTLRKASQLTKISDVHAADKISSVTDEGALVDVVGDLPEILRLIEGVHCINAENSGVAGGSG